MDASTPADLDRATTYTRIFRRISTLTTGATASAAATVAGGGAFEGLLVDSMLAREGRDRRPDAAPNAERASPPAAESEAAAADRRDDRERVSDRTPAPASDPVKERSEPAAADRSEQRTPRAELDEAPGGQDAARDVTAPDAKERPGPLDSNPSNEASAVLAAVANPAPAVAPPASGEAVGLPDAVTDAMNGGEATEAPLAMGSGIGLSGVDAGAPNGAKEAADAPTTQSTTPAAGAPAIDGGIKEDGADRRAPPQIAASTTSGQPAPASPHRPTAGQPPVFAPAPLAGDVPQPPAAANNTGAAADPRLAQAAIGITKDADAIRSSPLSSLIAASDPVGVAASEMTQQRRKSTTGNASAAQQPPAAAKPGTAGMVTPAAAAVATLAGQPGAGQPTAGQPGAQPTTPAAFGNTGATAGTTQPMGERPPLPSAGSGPALPAGDVLGDGMSGTSHGRFADALRADLKAEHAGGPIPRKPGLGDQVSVHITKAIKNGIDRIDIQLKPQSLGRVDVHLEMAGDGRVTATVTAETRHALELLQNDSRQLEQALQQAGLKTDSNSLNFNLRGQANSHGEQPRASHGGNDRGTAAEAGLEAEIDNEGGWSAHGSGAAGAGRLDIRA